jgi:hypothetical protein
MTIDLDFSIGIAIGIGFLQSAHRTWAVRRKPIAIPLSAPTPAPAVADQAESVDRLPVAATGWKCPWNAPLSL